MVTVGRRTAGRRPKSAMKYWPSGQLLRNSSSRAAPSDPVPTGLGRQARVVARHRLHVFLELLDALDREADVVHAGRDDSRAVVVGDMPWHDHQRHAAVGDIIVGVAFGLVAGVEFEHVDVELRHLLRVQRAHGDMTDEAILAALAGILMVGIDLGAVRHVLLRQVEYVAVRVMGGDAGERPRRRALEPFDLRVCLAHTLEHGFDVLDLDAEMIEPRRAPGAPRIDVEPDIAVADRHRALRPRLARRLHAEHRTRRTCRAARSSR